MQKMKATLIPLALIISDVALAQEAPSCRLLSEDKYARVWQCAPAPFPGNIASPPESNSTPRDGRK